MANRGAALQSPNGTTSATDMLHRTVALVGHAPSTRHLAPYQDSSVEIWTMNDAFAWIPRATRWFEIHTPEVYRHPARRSAGYMDFLQQFQGPVYMQYPDPTIQNAVKLDMDGLMSRHRRGVWGSSFGWMIALAFEEGFKRIELYGADLASQTEYFDQRESTAYWVGRCDGAGVEFYMPAECPLLTKEPYGPPQVMTGGLTRELMDNIGAAIAKEQGELSAKLNAASGKREMYAWFRSVLEGKTVAAGLLPAVTEQQRQAIIAEYLKAQRSVIAIQAGEPVPEAVER